MAKDLTPDSFKIIPLKKKILPDEGSDVLGGTIGGLGQAPITAGHIRGVTVTGGIIRTAVSGDRIEMNVDGMNAVGTGNLIQFWPGGTIGAGDGWIISGQALGINIESDLYMTGFIYPNANNLYDLGEDSTPKRWRTIYLINSPDVSSDRKGKKKIKPIKYGLGEVLQMKPISFVRKTKDKKEAKVKQLGFIAEELHKIVPEVATMESMKPDQIIPILVKAIQELDGRVRKLEKKL